MHTFLDNFHQGEKYPAQIASHQADLRREEHFTNQKYLSISSLQTEYLNLDNSSGCGINSDRANTVQKKCIFCGGANHSVENISKGSYRKIKKLVQLVIWITDKWNVRRFSFSFGGFGHFEIR